MKNRFIPRSLVWLTLCVVCAGTATAAADTPYDARQRKLARQVTRAGNSPQAALPLLEMARHVQDVSPALAQQLWQKVADTRSLRVEHRMYARRMLAWGLRGQGQAEASQRAFDDLGYVRAFRVIGAFDNEGKRGFDATLPPERSLLGVRDLKSSYRGKERSVSWRIVPDVVQGGYVSFDALLRPNDNVCALAETDLMFDEDRPITLWTGGGGALAVYFNGQEVLRDEAYRSPFPDRHALAVDARKGANRVLIKSCATEGTWGFYLRVGDRKGMPLQVRADPGRVEAAVAPLKPPRHRAPRTVLIELEAAAAKKRPRAQALEDLARYLSETGADDPAERRAAQLAAQAADKKASAARLLLAAKLAGQRYERMAFIQRAEESWGTDPTVRLARAKVTAEGTHAERALGMLQAVGEKGVHGLNAVRRSAAMFTQLGLPEAALAALEKAAERAPESTNLLWQRAEALQATEQREEALALRKQVLSLRQDHLAARRAMISEDLAQKRPRAVLEHLSILRSLYPSHERRLGYVARMYDALGRDDLKLGTLRQALQVAPDSASAHVAYGRALLRAAQPEAAADSFRAALALKPQDADTRELLEQLEPRERNDERFAIDRDALLARRRERNGHPVTVLQDLSVRTVFDNGLGAQFVQYAAQVHDMEGARQLRARSIQFDPDTQRVDVRMARVYRKDGRVLEATQTYEQQMGEPWYRVYYDTRSLTVVFPDLEPGDSVELRYRIDDIAQRNLFADYFGDMTFLQSGDPIAHVEYVLIAPSSRKLYFNKPSLDGLKNEVDKQGEQRIYRYWADDVPALTPEPNMPGMTEVLPYLHVSTYETWQDVGRWYWGLIKDQLYADDDLKRTVAGLKKKAANRRELVEKVYEWVVRNTRYVGLEFGIHGFLPYRVPEIVRRGFGDCKDKASLIYTMLKEAGVDARIVLVRTRRNGAIAELPASLSVFDHAIAYVPEFDLFLDGTAEHSGTRELPAGDQGVTVLVVGPKDAKLRKTPVHPAKANARTRSMSIQLAEDGSGEVKVKETISGSDAAYYRSTYQAPGTQAERLERTLAGRYPGLSLQQHRFEDLDQLESDIRLSYRLKAPQLAKRDGDQLRMAPSALGDLLRGTAPTPSRQYPLELGVPRAYNEERRVQLPRGHQAGVLPSGGTANSRFGQLQLEVERRGAELITRTRFEIQTDRVSPKDYPAFRQWIEEADQLLRQRISISASKK